MTQLVRRLGSLRIAVPLLVAIAGVLAWGTVYEARFGTAAVQHAVYRSWWFQVLLGFLAINLAAAAWQRYPWKRKHTPFLLAHLGIILILIGGILGGRLGLEGQLVIPEGQAERLLQLPHNIVAVRQLNPGVAHIISTRFDATAWIHEPHTTFRVPLEGRLIEVTVDRYYPNAEAIEQVTGDGADDNPAVRLALSHEGHRDAVWLFATDPERFGARWGQAHLLFVEASSETALADLLRPAESSGPPRGVVTIELSDLKVRQGIPVPDQFGDTVPLEGSPYELTFKAYFPDFAITEHGPITRSERPNNPAVALVLSGKDQRDAHLLFAKHPEFSTTHGLTQTIPASLTYTHPMPNALPPQTIGVVRRPDGSLLGLLTGPQGEHHTQECEVGRRFIHPWLGYEVVVEAYYPRAALTQQFINRNNEVKQEALHLVAREGTEVKETWLSLGGFAQLTLGDEPIVIEYRKAQWELPVTIKLLDFRKIDYPGTQMASGFESDIELTDPRRGLILMRTIRMNDPLRYRGFSFYQASYLTDPVETTVLAVRNDPGTPLVYAGFLCVILGVVSMFVLKSAVPRP